MYLFMVFFVVVVVIYSGLPNAQSYKRTDKLNICCSFLAVVLSGSSSDLVPTLMDIFDSMIGNQDPSLDQPSMMAANLGPSTINQQQQQRHFPVLKIVEPGDPEPVSSSPLNGTLPHLSRLIPRHSFLFLVKYRPHSHYIYRNISTYLHISFYFSFIFFFIFGFFVAPARI